MPRLAPFAFGLMPFVLAAGPVLALEVSQTVEVKAAPAAAWQAIEDFCSIQQWHPVIAKCEQSEEGGETRRTLTTGDGGVLLERRLGQDPAAMTMSYAIIESPLPVQNYESTMQVTPAGDGATVSWSSRFEAKGVPDEEAVKLITGIYVAGLEKLQSQLGK